jgi:NAD(P)-dependent dehydrogenase (short-subunit alcohol dehydrogenase family)
MRLALVIERFHPGVGGVETVAWNVAHGLARAGDEVHVVARRVAEAHTWDTHVAALREQLRRAAP